MPVIIKILETHRGDLMRLKSPLKFHPLDVEGETLKMKLAVELRGWYTNTLPIIKRLQESAGLCDLIASRSEWA